VLVRLNLRDKLHQHQKRHKKIADANTGGYQHKRRLQALARDRPTGDRTYRQANEAELEPLYRAFPRSAVDGCGVEQWKREAQQRYVRRGHHLRNNEYERRAADAEKEYSKLGKVSAAPPEVLLCCCQLTGR
jgi:hypothetical protein